MTLAWVIRSLTWRLFAFAVICPSAGSSGHPDNSSMIFYNDTQVQQFERWWSKSKTVPFYLIGLLLPLLNFKSPSFFSKFNILGKVLLRSMSGESHLPSCANLLSLFIHVILWFCVLFFCKIWHRKMDTTVSGSFCRFGVGFLDMNYSGSHSNLLE